MHQVSAQETPTVPLEVTLRIPGTWEHPRQLEESLPPGHRLVRKYLVLPDGSKFELYAHPADREFPGVFALACRQLPRASEREQIDDYTVNACLVGQGGSISAALRIMAAAAALVRAGGAGVFVDTSALAHGGSDWLALSHPENDETGSIHAFVTVVHSQDEVFSVGMHVLGRNDVVLPRSGHDEDDCDAIFRFLGETCGERTLRPGDVYTDPVLSRVRLKHEATKRFPRHLPMHNPYGQWRFVPPG
jgi:hypothetical protein